LLKSFWKLEKEKDLCLENIHGQCKRKAEYEFVPPTETISSFFSVPE
jgi:hypothetical protein